MSDLSAEDVARIKSSFAKILPHRDDFSIKLYDRLFAVAPEARRLFPNSMEMQREKLIATLVLVVRSADNLGELLEDVRALGRRHVDYGAAPSHYGILKTVLLETMAEVLGKDFDDETRQSWSRLYDRVAAVMIGED